MNTQKIWAEIEACKDYQKWTEKHDAFEQMAIIAKWCDYEYYSVTDYCKSDARNVIMIYCYIQFVMGVEFLSQVRDIAFDEECEDNTTEEVNKAKILINEITK